MEGQLCGQVVCVEGEGTCCFVQPNTFGEAVRWGGERPRSVKGFLQHRAVLIIRDYWLVLLVSWPLSGS